MEAFYWINLIIKMRKYSSDRKDSFNELRQKRLSIHSKTENKSVEE